MTAAVLLAPQDPGALSDQAQESARQGRFEEAEFEPGQRLGEQSLRRLHVAQIEQSRKELAARPQPHDLATRYLLGQDLSRLDRRDDALRAWRAALAIQPRNVRLMQVMIVEYAKGRYFQDEAALAARALELKPDDPDLYLLAIKAYQDARDFASGLALARRAAGRFPGSARANFEYAFHLQLAGDLAQACVYLDKALALDPHYEGPLFF